MPLSVLAAGPADFAGSYTLKSAKGGDAPDKGDVWKLQISETPGEIKITRMIGGHPSTEIFPLDGKEEDCRESDGGDAKCSSEWKGKTLTLETVYTAHPTENGPDVEMHTRERLELSSDGKTLTIRSETKAPQYSYLQMHEPTTEVYVRD